MTIKNVRNLRRLSQIVFFLIFFWLILKTNFEVNFDASNFGEIYLPYPVSIALQFDPLTALGVMLATRSLYQGLLWALVILIPTIFLGRFFCGWVCPLGTLNHLISEIPSGRLRRKGESIIDSNRYKKYQRIKYYIFFFFLTAALVGTLQIGLLDPLPFLARSLGIAVLPTLHTAAASLLQWVKSFDISELSAVSQFVYNVISPFLLAFRQVHFHAIFSIGLLLIIVLLLNRIFTRFWCRGICPLGAMLGLFSRYAIFGLKKDESVCNSCNKCLVHCQGADNPDIGSVWRQAECHLCLNCQVVCPESALKFKFFPAQKDSVANPTGTPVVDISRRKVIASLAGGALLLPLIRSGDVLSVNANPLLIRPPGAESEERFLARCIRCGQCMRVCPNNALHPTFLEAGLEGIWSPILIPRIGYCELTCTLCGQACPTGAITELTLKKKLGDEATPPTRIGTAFIDKGRCLPWAMAKSCFICKRWCPTRAIYSREENVYDRLGTPIAVKQPQVDLYEAL
ncbi:MAG: 4Fe-4S binding protein [candidate division Zixibacteria bacterium]|nr:4Fe-4S binding protein [candidate division Zixibacteria bacterium]